MKPFEDADQEAATPAGTPVPPLDAPRWPWLVEARRRARRHRARSGVRAAVEVPLEARQRATDPRADPPSGDPTRKLRTLKI